jgi:phenylacetate-CoA ligase
VLEVSRDGHLDAISVQVECTEGIAGDSSLRNRLTIELQRDIKDTIGICARVIVGAPGSIERSAAKAKHVVDKRNSP